MEIQYGKFIINKVVYKLYNVNVYTREYERAKGGLIWSDKANDRPFANDNYHEYDTDSYGSFLSIAKSNNDGDVNLSMVVGSDVCRKRIYPINSKNRSRRSYKCIFYPACKNTIDNSLDKCFDQTSLR